MIADTNDFLLIGTLSTTVWQTPRHCLYYSVWQLFQLLVQDERLVALNKMVRWASAEPVARSTHRSLSHEEVRALTQGELMEIGAHTVTHPFLTSHPPEFQEAEIKRSKADLEGILDRPITSFSYPFGAYTAETVALVREAGFTCACSSVADKVWRDSDCFELPRFEVQNWNGEEFARRLLRVFQ